MNQIRLQRFCGVQEHPVERVELYVDYGSPTLLAVELWCGPASSDTAPEGERCGWAKPNLTLWLPVPSLEPAELDELSIVVPWTYLAARDARQRLYVFEHEGLWDIRARLAIHGGEVVLRFTALARDPNHYGGDKPDTRVSGSARFPLPE